MVENKAGKVSDKDSKSSRYTTIGLNMSVGFVVFVLIGYKIDEKKDGVVFTLLGIFFGLFYIGYETWKLIRNSKD